MTYVTMSHDNSHMTNYDIFCYILLEMFILLLYFFCTDRVVDELNPERHFTANDIFSLLAPMVMQLLCCVYTSL